MSLLLSLLMSSLDQACCTLEAARAPLAGGTSLVSSTQKRANAYGGSGGASRSPPAGGASAAAAPVGGAEAAERAIYIYIYIYI